MFIFMLENVKQEKWNYHYLGNQNSINLGTKQQWEQRKKNRFTMHTKDKTSQVNFFSIVIQLYVGVRLLN